MSEPIPKTWGRPVEGDSFSEYATEYRASGVPDGGDGWWALVDIPAKTRLRRVTVADGTLLRFRSEAELRATGWEIDEAVHYGISHRNEPGAIFYLSPGTAANHADKTRTASVKYNFDEEGVRNSGWLSSY